MFDTLGRRHHTALAGVLALVALASLPGCKKEEASEAPALVRPVLVVEVRPKTTQVFGPFAGMVEPRYKSDLGFRTSGRMITRDVRVGDLVHKGQRLASLDETLLRYAVVKAKAQVNDAEGQLKNAIAGQARKRALVPSGEAPQSDLDIANTERKTADARLEQAKASEKRSEENLSYAALYAEFDGVVDSWHAEVGQDIAEGTGVVTIARPDIREAVVDIPDDLLDRVRENEVFTVALQAADVTTAKGRVREIAPSSDSATRTRRIRFTLDDASGAFRLGSTVNVSFQRPIPPLIEIPESAVLEKDGKTSVWVVPSGANKVTQHVVVLGEKRDGLVIVRQGLGAGDRVVVVGINRLKDGQAVRVATSFP